MRKSLGIAAGCMIALSACSQADDENAASGTSGAADSAATAEAVVSPVGDGSLAPALPATMPKLSHVYGLAFELPDTDIGKLMRRHADLCEEQGPSSCRIVGMDLSGEPEREGVSGKLQLAVASPHARAMTALLEKEAEGQGAEQTATTIGSEEVSKTIVDTEAHIRAREELRNRLTEILRTNKGSVKDLVEAERQVAAVNEEIDQARSWLAETQGRVAFSRVDVDYRPQAAAGSSFLAPIASAAGSLGSVLGMTIAALLVLATVLGPLAGLVWAGRRISRRLAAKA